MSNTQKVISKKNQKILNYKLTLPSLLSRFPSGKVAWRFGGIRYFFTKTPSKNRIGPHNVDVVSVIVGSLLGDAYGYKRTSEGVRLCFRQSIIHKDYLFLLYNLFFSRGYCSSLTPRKFTRSILNRNTKYYGY